MLVTRPLKVLTRHSTLAWLVKSSGLQGRLGNWAALLSQWTLEIVKRKKGEEQVLGVLAASITPRENVDSILSSIAPNKQSRQMRGEIECKASGLSPFRAKALSKLQSWPNQAVLHVKRDWDQSADQLASAALHQQQGVESIPRGEWSGLETINRLPEVLVPKDRGQTVKVSAVTRSRLPVKISGEVMQEDVLQQLRMDRIRDAQEVEIWVRNLKAYLKGDWKYLLVEAARNCSKMSEDYEISEEGLLVYCPGQRIKGDDRDITARLVIPESL
ncbi:unnamed protein product [Peronospora effusa]|nr:unnamed protein product [Peronospora effusa]